MTVSTKTHVFDLVSKRISTVDISGAPGNTILISALYPFGYEENLDFQAAIDRSWLVQFFPTEAIDLSATIVSGSLDETVAYKTYRVLDDQGRSYEAVDLSADVVSGDLIVTTAYQTYRYRENDRPYEAVNLEAQLAAGTLEVVAAYLTHRYREGAAQFEAVNLEATIVSGTLE